MQKIAKEHFFPLTAELMIIVSHEILCSWMVFEVLT